MKGKKMAEADLPFFRDYFVVNYREDVSHCLVMQELLWASWVTWVRLSYKMERRVFKWHSKIIHLASWRQAPEWLEMGYEEYNLYRHQCLVEYFSGTTYEQFSEFIQKCIVLNQALSGRDRDDLLKNGIEMSLRALVDVAPNMFPSFISMYLAWRHFWNTPLTT